MLLDEPLSALDLKLRQHMRAELRAIQKRTNVTFIYITHDQGEALAMSDRVGVMSQGKLQQVAMPQEIYNNPANGFVASFVGENNIFPGENRRERKDRRVRDTASALSARRSVPTSASQHADEALRAAGAFAGSSATRTRRRQRHSRRGDRRRLRRQFHQCRWSRTRRPAPVRRDAQRWRHAAAADRHRKLISTFDCGSRQDPGRDVAAEPST